MINTTGSTHPALDKITRITPIICACQRFELEMHQAQIGQFCSVLPED